MSCHYPEEAYSVYKYGIYRFTVHLKKVAAKDYGPASRGGLPFESLRYIHGCSLLSKFCGSFRCKQKNSGLGAYGPRGYQIRL